MTWQKGESGNPAGRAKKGETLAELLRSYLDKSNGDRRTHKQKIVEALVARAEEPDIAAVKLVFDKAEPGSVDVTDGVFTFTLNIGRNDGD